MIINKDTEMLLFRFSNYKRHSFINEHLSLLNNTGYVWMMNMLKELSLQDNRKGINMKRITTKELLAPPF